MAAVHRQARRFATALRVPVRALRSSVALRDDTVPDIDWYNRDGTSVLDLHRCAERLREAGFDATSVAAIVECLKDLHHVSEARNKEAVNAALHCAWDKLSLRREEGKAELRTEIHHVESYCHEQGIKQMAALKQMDQERTHSRKQLEEEVKTNLERLENRLIRYNLGVIGTTLVVGVGVLRLLL